MWGSACMAAAIELVKDVLPVPATLSCGASRFGGHEVTPTADAESRGRRPVRESEKRVAPKAGTCSSPRQVLLLPARRIAAEVVRGTQRHQPLPPPGLWNVVLPPLESPMGHKEHSVSSTPHVRQRPWSASTEKRQTPSLSLSAQPQNATSDPLLQPWRRHVRHMACQRWHAMLCRNISHARSPHAPHTVCALVATYRAWSRAAKHAAVPP